MSTKIYSSVRGVDLIIDWDSSDEERIKIKSPWPRLQDDGQLQNTQIGILVKEVIEDWKHKQTKKIIANYIKWQLYEVVVVN